MLFGLAQRSGRRNKKRRSERGECVFVSLPPMVAAKCPNASELTCERPVMVYRQKEVDDMREQMLAAEAAGIPP